MSLGESNLTGSSSETSQTEAVQVSDTSSEQQLSLTWEPVKIKGDKTTVKYWIVKNTRVCSEFCKSQLKVHDL